MITSALTAPELIAVGLCYLAGILSTNRTPLWLWAVLPLVLAGMLLGAT